MADNRYYGHFKAVMGRGDEGGAYYANMGNVYKQRTGIQRGYGHHMLGPRLTSRQMGLGFGSNIMSMFRMAVPILKQLGSRAVDLLSGVAKDTIDGGNVKDSLIKHAKNQANDILEKVPAVFTGIVSKGSEYFNNQLSPTVTGVQSTPISSGRNNRKRKGKKRVQFDDNKRQRGGGQYREGLALFN